MKKRLQKLGKKNAQPQSCGMESRISQENERFSKAFSGLEGEICDLTRMARLAQLQLHKAIGDLEYEDGKCVETPSTEPAELAIFAVDLLASKAKELEQMWYRLHNDAVS